MLCLVYLLCFVYGVEGYGYMLLYRPVDVTNLCAHSNRIMFDVTFGMGMSDTLTMIFRGLDELDYWCEVQILSESAEAIMIFVVRFPTMHVYQNCMLNPGALMVVMGESCVRVCSFATEDTISPYIVMSISQNLTFQFTSNSSINQYIFTNFYQVTVTTARVRPPGGCAKKNETECMANGVDYCFTSGVSCDGIKNCGVEDWFDERRSECVDVEDNLKIWSVLAFLAFFFFIIIAGCHLLIRCLPPITGSFFIFTANEDNRLCIDPKLVPSGSAPDIALPKQPSIIPISSGSSLDNIDAPVFLRPKVSNNKEEEKKISLQRKMTKTISEKVQSKLRSFANFSKGNERSEDPDV